MCTELFQGNRCGDRFIGFGSLMQFCRIFGIHENDANLFLKFDSGTNLRETSEYLVAFFAKYDAMI